MLFIHLPTYKWGNWAQTLQWPETYNLIYGRTVNPANRTLTSGGSSGGEGALIAMKGSPLGVGSDIGGYVPVLTNLSSHRSGY